MTKYDLTYATVDSLAEGVGSSQIAPLMEKLSHHGMKINLLTFEKESPPNSLVERMMKAGVEWTRVPFGNNGLFGGISRTIKLTLKLFMLEVTFQQSLHELVVRTEFFGMSEVYGLTNENSLRRAD